MHENVEFRKRQNIDHYKIKKGFLRQVQLVKKLQCLILDIRCLLLFLTVSGFSSTANLLCRNPMTGGLRGYIEDKEKLKFGEFKYLYPLLINYARVFIQIDQIDLRYKSGPGKV